MKPVQKNLKSVIFHIPHNSLDDFAQLCKILFTDSTIASYLFLGQTRIGYMVNFGLGPKICFVF